MLHAKDLHNPKMAQWLLRLGLAFVFGYASVASLQHPLSWVGYLPSFLATSPHAVGIVKVMAVYELVLALWLVVGKQLRLAAALATLTMAGIVLGNPSNFIITFRDIGLTATAAALFFLA